MKLLESARSFVGKFTGVAQLSQRLAESEQSAAIVQESLMSELQIALEDRGWIRLGYEHDQEFTPDKLKLITKIARVFFLKNPLIQRGVTLQADYVFGKGVKITGADETVDAAIKQFMADNESELSIQSLHAKECTLRTDGNLYFVLFDNNSDGRVRVRTIDSLEIIDKYCNPEDASEVWYFKRQWTENRMDANTGTIQPYPRTAWYPAIGKEAPLGKIGVDDVIKDSPVLHIKVGGLEKWKFGLSEVYAALDWAKAFTMFLESWATIQESLRRIAVQIKTPGGTKAQQRIKTAVGQTTLADSAGQMERNPPPVTGAWWIGGAGQELMPLLTKNATTAPDEARQLKLQVCAALGVPEHMFGDPSTGNLATAKTLDRPTELKFTLRQELWRAVLKTIVDYALLRSAQAPSGSLKEAQIDRSVAVSIVTFPPVLEHDMKQWVDAVVSAATLDGKSLAGTIDPKSLAKMLLSEIPGIQNVDDLVDEMYPDAGYDPEEWAAKTPDEKAAMAPDPMPTTAQTKRQEALRALRNVIESLAAAA